MFMKTINCCKFLNQNVTGGWGERPQHEETDNPVTAIMGGRWVRPRVRGGKGE